MKLALIIIICILVIAIGLAIAYLLLKKKHSKTIEKAKTSKVTILVLSKKKAKPKDGNFNKQVLEQIPKLLQNKKLPIVIAKVGGKITPLICEESCFNKIQPKKTQTVELSGMSILGVIK